MIEQEFEFIHDTNWLGLNSIFYNTKNGKFNTNINALVDLDDIRFNLEGLQNYLVNGFAIFGQTPLEDIYFTMPNTSLLRSSNGEFKVILNPDPLLPLLENHSHVEDVLELLEVWFDEFKRRISDRHTSVVLPLSGGYDSRMMASFMKNKDYVHTYSYGISMNQSRSYEVILAKKAAKKMNLNWNQIELGKFHQYLNENFNLYGVSAHAHSMYHFEFYRRILDDSKLKNRKIILSGIYGDVWAGSWAFPKEISRPPDISTLVKNHGLNWYGDKIEISATNNAQTAWFDYHSELLRNPKYRILAAARLKAPLIRHLIDTPKSLGFEVESPFFDPIIVATMLNLPQEERSGRKWQKSFVERTYGKDRRLFQNRGNNSDLMGTHHMNPPRLEMQLLSNHLPEIAFNKKLKVDEFKIRKYDLMKSRAAEIRGILRLFPFLGKFKSNFTSQYASYLTIYPIIQLLKRSQEILEE